MTTARCHQAIVLLLVLGSAARAQQDLPFILVPISLVITFQH
jgi:hypothetical protein